jgi:hypothetical protein
VPVAFAYLVQLVEYLPFGDFVVHRLLVVFDGIDTFAALFLLIFVM